MRPKRRVDVMLSSTFFDLEDKRLQVRDLMGRHEFYDVVMEKDASLPTLDKIASSLRKVDRAEAYVCVIGYRYGTREFCATRNPENLSLTELEWRRARERAIPRCTLIMSPKYTGIQLADMESVSAEDKQSLAAFRKLAESDMVYAPFDSDTDFQLKAMQSLDQLRRDIEDRDAEKAASHAPPQELAAPSQIPAGPDDKLPAAAPALHFVRKPYVEKQCFAGRLNELAQIDSWAKSKDTMLLFHAIGGMGKSMLTWHWIKYRAVSVRADWAGRLWYTFYEQGADLRDFCVHALAYIRNQPPRMFRGLRTIDLGEELRRELDISPWLLILDGLERVLVAYNRDGKEHMTDEDAAVMKDGLGLDREPRSCFRPEDDEVLAMLAQAECGKLLASSRLVPTALTSTTWQPIPGVSQIALEGLAPADAEQVLSAAGVRGDGWRMQRFLEQNFACHPLAVGVVAGLVTTFLEARGDFDAWVDHPKGGAEPALLAQDLRGRQSHILAVAFEGLDADEKALLGAIAMANIDLPMEVLRIINPKRPIEPKKPKKPGQWTETELFRNTSNPEIDSAFYEWRQASSPEAHAKAQHILDDHREKNWLERTKHYETELAAHQNWTQQASEADDWLLRTLPRLEARGLLQFDASSETLDMHPAIRHTAITGLSPETRKSTGAHVSDSLSSRPRRPFVEARTLDDLALAITRVKALNSAEKFEAGWSLLIPELGDALLRLEREDVLSEILHSYFPKGWDHPPLKVTSGFAQTADPLQWAARALSGNLLVCRQMQEQALRFDLSQGDAGLVCDDLCNLPLLDTDIAPVARRFGLLTLAKRLADALVDGECRRVCLLHLAEYHLDRGKQSDSHACLEACRADFDAGEMTGSGRARFVRLEVALARRSGRLTSALIESSIALVQSLGQVASERLVLEEVAGWHRDRGAHREARAAYGDLIALANTTSARVHVPVYQARRAISLIALGLTNEALPIVLRFEKHAKKPNLLSAVHYLALGEAQKAREHVLGAYKDWWGDGPPFHHHWSLEICRQVLAAVGEPEPALPCAPSNLEPFDFEADIERLIEKKLTEKAGREKRTRLRG
jgi:Domain of unknown function (DUF4062)